MSFRCVQITSRLSSAILSSPFSSLHCSSSCWRCPFVSLARPLPASRIRMRPPSSASKLALSWPLSPTFDRARGQSAKVSRRWDTSVNFHFFSPFKSPAERKRRALNASRIALDEFEGRGERREENVSTFSRKEEISDGEMEDLWKRKICDDSQDDHFLKATSKRVSEGREFKRVTRFISWG